MKSVTLHEPISDIRSIVGTRKQMFVQRKSNEIMVIMYGWQVYDSEKNCQSDYQIHITDASSTTWVDIELVYTGTNQMGTKLHVLGQIA